MEAEAQEALYDEQIAPLLAQAGKIAYDHDIALAAFCQWGPSDSGRTLSRGPRTSEWLASKLVRYAILADGNADALIIALMREARKRGHGSVALSVLGVPSTPTAGPAAEKP